MADDDRGRRLLVVLVLVGIALVVVLLGGITSYRQAGGALSVSAGRTGGPLAPGDDLTLLVPVEVDGTVKITSVRAVLDGSGARLETTLVELGDQPTGSYAGPDQPDLEAVRLPARVHGDGTEVARYAVQVRITPEVAAVHEVDRIQVRYTTGWLRSKAATADRPLCVDASASATLTSTACDPPEG